MADTDETDDAFKNRCAHSARVLATCTGHFIERVSFDAFSQEDSLEIALREGPWKPDVLVSLSDLRYIRVAKPAELSGSFTDFISLTHLPKSPDAWPDDVAGRVHRFALAAETGYDTALAGHGLPTGPEIYEEVRRYLAAAEDLLGDDGEAYKKAIVDRCPTHIGPFLIDIANRSLFGTAR